MADIDQIIAGGAGAGTTADFSGIPKLLDSYWAGLDQRAKNDLRDAFKPTADNPNGVPMKDGQIDIPTVAKMLFQKGDIAGGTGLLGTVQAAQDRTDYFDSLKSKGPQTSQPPINVPSANRTASAVVAPPLNKGGVQSPGQSPQGDQPGSIVGLVSAAGVPDELAGPIIQQASAMSKIDPNAALDPATSQRMQKVIQAAAQRMKGGQQPQPSGLTSQEPPQVAQAQPQVQAPQGFQPSPAQVAAQNDPELKRARYFAASRDKAIAASALATQKSIEDSRQPTTEMKNASAPGLLERQGQMAAEQAGAIESAKGYVEKYKNINEAGDKAVAEIPKLKLALKQMDDPNYYSGAFNQYNLGAKRIVAALGGDPDKAAPQEIVNKITADSILNGMGALKGLGPIRVAEMKILQQASLSPDNSTPAQKFLATMAIRVQEHAAKVSDMAQNYNEGVIDNGFDKQIRAMDKKEPLFSPAEIERFQRISQGKEKEAPQQGANRQAAAAPAAFPNAKQAPDGNFYMPDPARPGKYLKVVQ